MLPYTAVVELEIGLPCGDQIHVVGTFPILVSPDTDNKMKVAALIGTNVLDIFQDQLTQKHCPMSALNKPLLLACQTIKLSYQHMQKAAGVYGLLRAHEHIHIPPHTSLIVNCSSQVVIPLARIVAGKTPPSSSKSLHVAPWIGIPV